MFYAYCAAKERQIWAEMCMEVVHKISVSFFSIEFELFIRLF